VSTCPEWRGFAQITSVFTGYFGEDSQSEANKPLFTAYFAPAAKELNLLLTLEPSPHQEQQLFFSLSEGFPNTKAL